MKTQWLAVIAGCAMVAGCVRPLPVKQPTTADLSADHVTVIGLPVPSTIDDVRRQLRAYERVYANEAAERLLLVHKGADTTLAGNLIGMAGGLAQSPEVSVLGLLLSTGGAIPEQRYRMALQADNYNQAADAMRCLQRAIAFDSSLGKAELALVNDHMDIVRRTLRDRMVAIVPASVDVGALETAIRNEIDARRTINSLDADENKIADDISDAWKLQQARLDALAATLEKCTAA